MAKGKTTTRTVLARSKGGGKTLQNNMMTDALLGTNPFYGVGTNFFSQLSQTDTLFKNNRWYLISNNRTLLAQIYVEHGLIQTLIDLPVDDGLRGGVNPSSRQLSEAQVHELKVHSRRQGIMQKLGQALKWTRLYGGGALIINTEQLPETPLILQDIQPGMRVDFIPCDLWELYYDHQVNNADEIGFNAKHQEFYSYYGKKIHRSRVLKFSGLPAPSMLKPRLRGWGYSVTESVVRSVNNYLKANDLTFEVLDEFKIDVFKMKGLNTTLIGPKGEERVRQRVSLANTQKNFQSAIVMDGEDDFMQKELSFAGLAETMTGIRLQIASDLRMPLTKVFGQSATGFNSGEDDIENYNAMVESQVREKCQLQTLAVFEVLCQNLFGFVPDDLEIEFESLRVLSSKDQEEVKDRKFNRTLQAAQAGFISTKEFKEACNKDKLLPIQIDATTERIEMQAGGEDPGDEEQLQLEDNSEADTAAEEKAAQEVAQA